MRTTQKVRGEARGKDEQREIDLVDELHQSVLLLLTEGLNDAGNLARLGRIEDEDEGGESLSLEGQGTIVSRDSSYRRSKTDVP